uniref:285.6 kDa replicase n=1 Tax=Rose latent virus 1 TaxID=3071804 RepID=A0AA51EXN9_9VIRU|nr:285.6 kDa replicase [Rose latent virus 1]
MAPLYVLPPWATEDLSVLSEHKSCFPNRLTRISDTRSGVSDDLLIDDLGVLFGDVRIARCSSRLTLTVPAGVNLFVVPFDPCQADYLGQSCPIAPFQVFYPGIPRSQVPQRLSFYSDSEFSLCILTDAFPFLKALGRPTYSFLFGYCYLRLFCRCVSSYFMLHNIARSLGKLPRVGDVYDALVEVGFTGFMQRVTYNPRTRLLHVHPEMSSLTLDALLCFPVGVYRMGAEETDIGHEAFNLIASSRVRLDPATDKMLSAVGFSDDQTKAKIIKALYMDKNSRTRTIIDSQVCQRIESMSGKKQSKPKVILNQSLTPKEECLLEDAYPEFEIQFKSRRAADHAIAAASRKLEMELLLMDSHYTVGCTKPPKGYAAALVDAGGNWSTHVLQGREYIHSCAPILSAYDDQREAVRLDTIKNFFPSGSGPSVARREKMLEQVRNKSTVFRVRCKNRVQDCRVKAPAMILLHSAYDITLTQLADAMVRHHCTVARGTMIFSPEILLAPNGEIESLGCIYSVDVVKDSISFCFRNDPSLSYTHKFSEYRKYFTNSYFLDSSKKVRFYIQLSTNRIGVQFFNIFRSASRQVPKSSLTHNLWAPTFDKKMLVSYYKFNVRAHNVKVAMQPVHVVIPTSFYDKLMQYAIRLHDSKFNVTELFSYACGINSRVIIDGAAVAAPEKVPLEALVIASHAIYLQAYCRRFELGKIDQTVVKSIQAERQLGEGTILKKLARLIFRTPRSVNKVWDDLHVLLANWAVLPELFPVKIEKAVRVLEFSDLLPKFTNPDLSVWDYQAVFDDGMVEVALDCPKLVQALSQTESSEVDPIEGEPISSSPPVTGTFAKEVKTPVPVEINYSLSNKIYTYISGGVRIYSVDKPQNVDFFHRLKGCDDGSFEIIKNKIKYRGSDDPLKKFPCKKKFKKNFFERIFDKSLETIDCAFRSEVPTLEEFCTVESKVTYDEAIFIAHPSKAVFARICVRESLDNLKKKREQWLEEKVFGPNCVDKPSDAWDETTLPLIVDELTAEKFVGKRGKIMKKYREYYGARPEVKRAEITPADRRRRTFVLAYRLWGSSVVVATWAPSISPVGVHGRLLPWKKNWRKKNPVVLDQVPASTPVPEVFVKNASPPSTPFAAESVPTADRASSYVKVPLVKSEVLSDVIQVEPVPDCTEVVRPSSPLLQQRVVLVDTLACGLTLHKMSALPFPDTFEGVDKVGRRECTFYSTDASLHYGHDRIKYTTTAVPLWLEEFFKCLSVQFATPFNTCLMNKYSTNGGISWHADDEPCYTDKHPIVTVNLIGRGVFETKCKKGPCNAPILEESTILVMPAGFQSTHKHKVTAIDDVRVSLTFRVHESPTPLDTVDSTVRSVPVELQSYITDGCVVKVCECLEKHSLTKVPGDGNCFYHSLNLLLSLKSNPVEIKKMMLQKVQLMGSVHRVALTRHLTTPNDWADTVAIQLAAVVFGVNIKIHSPKENSTCQEICASDSLRSICMEMKDQHFSPLLRTDSVSGGFESYKETVSERDLSPAQFSLNKVAQEYPHIVTVLSEKFSSLNFNEKRDYAQFQPLKLAGDELSVWIRNAIFEQLEYWRVSPAVLHGSLSAFYADNIKYFNNSRNERSELLNRSYALYSLKDRKWLVHPLEGVEYEYGFNGKVFLRMPKKLSNGEKKSLPDHRAYGDLILFTPETQMMQDSRLFLTCRGIVADTDWPLIPEIEYIEGVPGCGKTTYVINNHVASKFDRPYKGADVRLVERGDLVLTATKEAAKDFRTRLTEKGERAEKWQYRTIDSFLLNGRGLKFDKIWVDEALMMHVGSIFMACHMARAKKLVLIGDRKQIPYISRLPGVDLNFHNVSFKIPVNKTLNISYRCPRDVAAAFHSLYTPGMQSASKLKDTLSLIKITSLSDVQKTDKPCQYLCFKQAEKAELKKKGFLPVNTVHEYQGKTAAHIRVVRLSHKPNEEIYRSESHVLVAMTRHTQSLEYFTPVMTDSLAKRVSVIPSARDLQRATHDVDLAPQNFSAGYTPEPNNYGPLFAEQPHSDPLVALQTWYDGMLPGDSVVDQSYDQDICHHADLSISVSQVQLQTDKGQVLNAPRSTMRPKLRTGACMPRKPSQRETLLGFYKRNANVPELQGCVDERKMVTTMVARFKEAFVSTEGEQLLESFHCRPIVSSSVAIEDWLRSQPNTMSEQIFKNDLCPEEKALNEYKYMNKREIKPALDGTATTEYKAVQTIAFNEKDINATFCPIFRTLTDRLLAILKKNFIVFTQLSSTDFEQVLNERFPPEMLRHLKTKEIDFSKYDKSQGRLHLLFEIEIFKMLGLDSRYLFLWYKAHATSEVKDYSNGFKAWLQFQRKSGDAATFIGNTIVLMGVLSYLFDFSRIAFGAFGGDDSILWAPADVFARDQSYTCATLFNLESKFLKFESFYFCSKFIINVGDNWYVVPDPLKVVFKLGRSDLVDPVHVREYYTSLCDLLGVYKNAVINEALSEVISERYPSEFVDHSFCFGAIASALDSFKNFSELFEDPGDLIIDPSRPRLF